MNDKRDTRSGWVWSAVVLQGVVFLLAAWSSVNVLFVWSRYGQGAMQVLGPVLARATMEAVAAGIAFAGLWQSKRWGWILALLTETTLCLLTLSSLIRYSTLLLRKPQWLAFSVWDFAAIAVLLHPAVRNYFLAETELPRHAAVQGAGHAAKANTYPGFAPIAQGAVPRKIHGVERCARVLSYFVASVAVTCIVTSFAVTMQLGQKAGGGRGFLFVLLFGFVIGWGPSLLFVLLLTLAARVFGPGRLGVWLLAGLLLAPGLTLGMAILASKLPVFQGGIFAVFFTGPIWLFQVWWLTIPAGLVTGYLCALLFTWSFGEMRRAARPLRLQD